MRLLADENLPGRVVEALRRLGHDVTWVRMDAPGSLDERVLERAASERRVLVTADKDSRFVGGFQLQAASSSFACAVLPGRARQRSKAVRTGTVSSRL